MGDGDELNFYSSTPAEGYSVCSRCFGDVYIKAFITSNLETQVCDFCGRRGRIHPIATPLAQVVDFMIPAVEREYQMAADALGWDGREGGYQGSHWDSRDLLTDEIGLELPNDDSGQLLDVLVNCFGDQFWCERNPYSLRRDERLIGSWEDFCNSIKHERRYFFFKENEAEPPGMREYLSPSELLEFISETVNEHELVRDLPEASLLYRARQYKRGEILHSPYDFAPPDVEHATKSNRMSPAGIVMFYGSYDWKTAVSEIDDDLRLGIAVGTFRTTRVVKVLDLTQLPERFGFFEQQPDSSSVDRYALNFLHSFVKSMATRVEPGRREYIDYVPTQVVTEWFRARFRHRGALLDGILYSSAQREGGGSVVLFATRNDLVLSPKQIREIAVDEAVEEWEIGYRHEKAWLKFVRRLTVRLPKP